MNSETPHRPWKDSALTLATSGAVIVLSVLTAGFLSRKLSASGFEDYLFIRRFIAILFPIMTLSAGTGLTWFLASSRDDRTRDMALRGSLYVVSAVNILFLAVAVMVPRDIFVSYVFPVAGDARTLRLATFFWLISYSGYVLMFSALRGKMRMAEANWLNLAANGAIPFLSVAALHFAGGLSVESFLYLTGGGYFLCYPRYIRLARGWLSTASDSVAASLRTVISYGIPRIPAGFLLSFPAYVIPFFLIKSGWDSVYFLSALMLLQTAAYLTDPLGQVFLPGSAKLSGENDLERLSSMTSELVSASLHIGMLATVQIFLLSEILITLWFGEGLAEAGGIAGILSLSLVPILLYTPLRSILDGIEKKPLITHILTAASLFCLVLCILLRKSGRLDSSGAAWAMVATNVIICIMLYIAAARRIRIRTRFAELAAPAALCLGGGAATYFVIGLLPPDCIKFPLRELLILAISAILNGLGVILWLRFRPPGWWRSAREEFASR